MGSLNAQGAMHSHLPFREVLDQIISFVGVLDPQGCILDVNEPALAIAGKTLNDVIGQRVEESFWFSHDVIERQRIRDAVLRAQSGERVRFDTTARVADGRQIDIDFQIVPHYGDYGELQSLIPSAIDITERKRTERKVAAAQKAFESALQNCPFGVMLLDNELRIKVMSAGARAVFADVPEVQDRDLYSVLRDVWPKPFADEVIGQYYHTLISGEALETKDATNIRVDTGLEESYDYRIERALMPDGSHGIICHFYDLSERIALEKEVQASEVLFRSTFDNAAVGVAHVGIDGTWLRVNDKLTRILGYDREELMQLTFQEITHPEDLDSDLELVEKVIQGEIDEYDLEKRYLHKSGRTIWVILSVGCVRNEDGSVERFISSINDISAQKEAESQRDMLVFELNHRVKNVMATVQSVASHTMRTSEDLKDFKDRFSGRLQSIAQAHDNIFDAPDHGVDLQELIEDQFDVYLALNCKRVSLQGEPLALHGRAASGLGIIVHELITNAMKYGALSEDFGTIQVSWALSPHEGTTGVELAWKEAGGPEVTEPQSVGFGSRLIQIMVEQKLGGSMERTFSPEGLSCTFRFEVPHGNPEHVSAHS